MSALLGRILQIVGMIVLPVGLVIGLIRNDVRMEVRLLVIGGVVYLLGWILAREKT